VVSINGAVVIKDGDVASVDGAVVLIDDLSKVSLIT
jgi:hypothetical protein